MQANISGDTGATLNSYQKLGRLESFGLDMYDVIAWGEVTNGVSPSRAGRGMSGLTGELICDGYVSAADGGASRASDGS